MIQPTTEEHHSATFIFTAGSIHPLMAQMVRNLPAYGRPGWFNPSVGKIPWKRAWQPTPAVQPRESPWTARPGGLHPWGRKELDTTEQRAQHSTPSPTPSAYEPSDASHLSPSYLWLPSGPASIPSYRYPHISKVCFIALHSLQKIYTGPWFPNRKKSEEDFPFTKQGEKQKERSVFGLQGVVREAVQQEEHQELPHSASQHQSATDLNCVWEHACSISIYFVHPLARCVSRELFLQFTPFCLTKVSQGFSTCR